jgi:hypothetical protein
LLTTLMIKKIFIFILLMAMHLPNVYAIIHRQPNDVICKCMHDDDEEEQADFDECDCKLEKKIEDCNVFHNTQEFLFLDFHQQSLLFYVQIADRYINNHCMEIVCPPPNVA